MNPPQVYMCSPFWTPLPPPSPYHPSGSSPCTSPKHAVSCVRHRLAIQILHDSIHDRMPFSQIIPPSPSPTGSISLFYTPVSLLLSQRDGMGREVGGGFRIGNTCTPVADSCWSMAKPIQYCKVKKKKNYSLKLVQVEATNLQDFCTWSQNYSHSFRAAAKSLQSCLTLCDPTDGSPPGSSVPGILQAKILEKSILPFLEYE